MVNALVQEVSIKIFKRIHKDFQEKGGLRYKPEIYIRKGAKWILATYFEEKRKLREREIPYDFCRPFAAKSSLKDDRRVRKILADACKSPKMARDLYLRFIEQWNSAEIAEFAEEPASTIRDRINRGKRALLIHAGKILGISSADREELYQFEMRGKSLPDLARARGQSETEVRERLLNNRKKVFCWILKK